MIVDKSAPIEEKVAKEKRNFTVVLLSAKVVAAHPSDDEEEDEDEDEHRAKRRGRGSLRPKRPTKNERIYP